MKAQIVSILGERYVVELTSYQEDNWFEKYHISGYCCGLSKRIVVCDPNTNPNWIDEADSTKKAELKATIRHEIVHAFLHESGLTEASIIYDKPWATNEEMVEWFALQGPKIYRAWKEADALVKE